ncbi:MAG: ABC transporter substrate-binding protein [Alphaproteobacteria bacterium]
MSDVNKPETKTSAIGRREVLIGGAALAATVAMPAIVRAQAAKEIVIGAVLPMTGPSGAFGQESWNSMQFGADVINAAGGIKSMGGAKLKPMVADTESKPEVAVSQTEQMIRRGAAVIVGCNQSSASIVASQVAERASVPFLTAYDVDPLITARGFKFVFRISPLSNVYASDLLAYIKQVGEKAGKAPKRLALLSENSVVGQGANKVAAAAAAKLGFEVVDTVSYEVGKTQNFAPFIAKFKGANVEVVVGHTRASDGILIVRTMKELAFNPLAYGGILGAPSTTDFIRNLGKDAENILATDSWSSTLDVPNMKELGEKYQERFKVQPSAGLASAMSNIAVITDSLERAKTTDGKKLRDAMAATDMKTGDRNLWFLTGAKFNATGDNDRAAGLVSVIRDGKWIPVAPKVFSKGDVVYPKPKWS